MIRLVRARPAQKPIGACDMKVGAVNPATQHAIELKKFDQQRAVNEQQQQQIIQRQHELQKLRAADTQKGRHIDKMV